MKPNIEIYIDKIVLHGYDKKQGREISAALEQQLRTLLKENGLTADFVKDAYIRKMDGGQLEAGKSQQIGAGIANNIYNSINQTNQQT